PPVKPQFHDVLLGRPSVNANRCSWHDKNPSRRTTAFTCRAGCTECDVSKDRHLGPAKCNGWFGKNYQLCPLSPSTSQPGFRRGSGARPSQRHSARQNVPARNEAGPLECLAAGDILRIAPCCRDAPALVTDSLQFLNQVRAD